MCVTSRVGALLDRNVAQAVADRAIDRGDADRRRGTARPRPSPRAPSGRSRSCSRRRRWPRRGRRPRARDRSRPAGAGVRTRCRRRRSHGTPASRSSKAVRRAPWLRGRVSSTTTSTGVPARDRGVDGRERRAAVDGRERAGVAVGQDAHRTRPPDARPRLVDERHARSRRSTRLTSTSASAIASASRRATDARRCRRHAAGAPSSMRADRPRQIDGRRARRRRARAQRRRERRVGRIRAHREPDPVGRRDADQRRPAHDHRPDRVDDVSTPSRVAPTRPRRAAGSGRARRPRGRRRSARSSGSRVRRSSTSPPRRPRRPAGTRVRRSRRVDGAGVYRPRYAPRMLEHEAQTVLLVKAFEEADPDGSCCPSTTGARRPRRRGGDASDPARGAARAGARACSRSSRRSCRAPRPSSGDAPRRRFRAVVLVARVRRSGWRRTRSAPHRRIERVAMAVRLPLRVESRLVRDLPPRAPARPIPRAPARAGAGSRPAPHGVASLAGRGARLAGRARRLGRRRASPPARRKRDARTAADRGERGRAASPPTGAARRRRSSPRARASSSTRGRSRSRSASSSGCTRAASPSATRRRGRARSSTRSTLQRMVDALLGPGRDGARASRCRTSAPYARSRPRGAVAPPLRDGDAALRRDPPHALPRRARRARVARLSGARAGRPLRRATSGGPGSRPRATGARVRLVRLRLSPGAARRRRADGAAPRRVRHEVRDRARRRPRRTAPRRRESPAPDRARTLVVLVSLAQTPESEVHGAFLASLVARGRVRSIVDRRRLPARGAGRRTPRESRSGARLWTRDRPRGGRGRRPRRSRGDRGRRRDRSHRVGGGEPHRR